MQLTVPPICPSTGPPDCPISIIECLSPAQAQTISGIPHCPPTTPLMCITTAQAQAQAHFPTMPPNCAMTSPLMCPPSVGCPPAQAQTISGIPHCPPTTPLMCITTAQAQTDIPNTLPPMTSPGQCPPSFGCPPAHAQVATTFTQITTCATTMSPQCPTYINCHPPQAQAPAQAQTLSAVPGCRPTVGCPTTVQAQVQAPPTLTQATTCSGVPTICPNDCIGNYMGGYPAQAQTISGIPHCPPTVPGTCTTIPQPQAQYPTTFTKVTTCSGMPTICTTQCLAPAQAQTLSGFPHCPPTGPTLCCNPTRPTTAPQPAVNITVTTTVQPTRFCTTLTHTCLPNTCLLYTSDAADE